jgi:hypothetical protein
METMRATWTDERLDDLADRMDRGFDRVDTDVRELRSEMNTRFDAMQGTMDGRFDSMQQQLAATQGTMTTILASMLTGIFVVIVGFVVTNI